MTARQAERIVEAHRMTATAMRRIDHDMRSKCCLRIWTSDFAYCELITHNWKQATAAFVGLHGALKEASDAEVS